MKNKNIKPPHEITRYITWMGVSRHFGSQDRPRTWDVPVAEISFTLKLHGKCPPWYSRWVARSWSGAMHSSHRRCSWQRGQAIGPRANLESQGSCLWEIYGNVRKRAMSRWRHAEPKRRLTSSIWTKQAIFFVNTHIPTEYQYPGANVSINSYLLGAERTIVRLQKWEHHGRNLHLTCMGYESLRSNSTFNNVVHLADLICACERIWTRISMVPKVLPTVTLKSSWVISFDGPHLHRSSKSTASFASAFWNLKLK